VFIKLNQLSAILEFAQRFQAKPTDWELVDDSNHGIGD